MHYDAIYVEKKLLHVSLLLKKYLERYYISMFFDNTMIKKYMIKLNINSHCGNLFIYYKPTTNTYTLVKNLKKNTENINYHIDKAWDSITKAYVYPNTFGIYESFVDGSFFNGIVGYGAMIYLGDRIKKTIYGSILKDEILVHRQFVGELQAVIETIKWCIWNKITKIR
ncbi:MAG: hypothetical protein LBM05_02455, partial [Endomicrobium sp.]|nr:hypothetical protein [Endomicrobium sp.]